MKPRIVVLNGSLGGKSGNTGTVLALLVQELAPRADVEEVTLSESYQLAHVLDQIGKSQGLVIATGTYWDSWGSPLQRFLEESTDHEATDTWLGKPVATLVTMHSVGGKEVLSRLQGVLSTLGCLIPPMSGLTYSLANHLALKGDRSPFHDDLWQLPDLKVIASNLLMAIDHYGNRPGSSQLPPWTSWPVDSGDPRRKWFSV